MTKTNRAEGKFILLFGFMLAQLAILPVFEGNEDLAAASDLVYFALVFYVVQAIRRDLLFWLSAALFAATLACYGGALLYPANTGLLIVLNGVAGAFLITVVFSILSFVVTLDRVTLDAVLGGLCVYLLIGEVFALAYINIELLQPGSFNFGVHGAPGNVVQLYDLLYFYSFVSLLTIGYGDILPISHLAQTLSVLEGVIGQLYLVFCVAALVGLYLSGRMTSP
jgi:hypothetical protein